MSSIVGMTSLIYGGTRDARMRYINSLIDSSRHRYTSVSIDILTVEKASIGIGEVRRLIQQSNYTSLSAQHRFFVIADAHKLTDQAQNALLKLYEEPHEHSTYILELDSYQSLLPTILSRAVFINIASPNTNLSPDGLSTTYGFPPVADFRKLQLPELFKLCEEYGKDRSVAIAFVSYSMFIVADVLRSIRGDEQKKLMLYTEFLLQAHEWLVETNVSPRLVLENCVLGWWNNFR